MKWDCGDLGLGFDVEVGSPPLEVRGGPRGDSHATFRRRVAWNQPPRPNPTPKADFDFDLETLEEQNKKSRPLMGPALFGSDVRRCPTLPRGLPRSTIGAEGLNFRVRDGTGCFPLAMAAATLWKYQPCSDGSRPYSGNRIVDASPPVARGIHAMTVSVCQALGLLVPVS